MIQKPKNHIRAVSPAIGIALLLAIVVVLAAILGAAAAGYVSQDEVPASALFSASYCNDPANGDTLRIVHEAGDTVRSENLVLRYDDVMHITDNGERELNGTFTFDSPPYPEEFKAGDTVFASNIEQNLQFEDAKFTLVWNQSGRSFPLKNWETDVAGSNQSGRCSFPAESPFAVSLNPACGDGSPGANDRGHGNEGCRDEDPDNPGRGDRGGNSGRVGG
jgi:hypothetical protein